MIIDNHFHRIISNFGYRLRALQTTQNLTFGKLHLSSYIPDIMNRDCSNLLLFLELFKPSLQFFLFLCNLNNINDHKYIIIFIITISSQSEESHWKTSQSRSTITITVTSLIIRTTDVHQHHSNDVHHHHGHLSHHQNHKYSSNSFLIIS